MLKRLLEMLLVFGVLWGAGFYYRRANRPAEEEQARAPNQPLTQREWLRQEKDRLKRELERLPPQERRWISDALPGRQQEWVLRPISLQWLPRSWLRSPPDKPGSSLERLRGLFRLWGRLKTALLWLLWGALAAALAQTALGAALPDDGLIRQARAWALLASRLWLFWLSFCCAAYAGFTTVSLWSHAPLSFYLAPCLLMLAGLLAPVKDEPTAAETPADAPDPPTNLEEAWHVLCAPVVGAALTALLQRLAAP